MNTGLQKTRFIWVVNDSVSENLQKKRYVAAGALIALGKLVCRTSPVEVYRCVQIEKKNEWLYLRTCNPDEMTLNKMIFFDVNGLSKGGKQNISAEEFTLKSDPNEVREKISELKMEKNQLDRKCNRKEIQDITNRLNKLRGILKVILRNQKFIFLIFIPSIDTKIEEIERNRREKFREQHGLGGNIA